MGNCPKSESSRKWLGEGAKGLLDPASKRPLALVRNRVAPVQKRVWVVQKTLGRPLLPGPTRVQKDPLHPPLTTFGDFPFLGNFPGPQHFFNPGALWEWRCAIWVHSGRQRCHTIIFAGSNFNVHIWSLSSSQCSGRPRLYNEKFVGEFIPKNLFGLFLTFYLARQK